jgi:ethanolamine ammonia-lyase small subunit
LREDHAAARDAVHDEFDTDVEQLLAEAVGGDFWCGQSLAASKQEYLMRPDLGRRLSESTIERLQSFPKKASIQVVVGDGLSVTAVARQAPSLLRLFAKLFCEKRRSYGQPFGIRYCRVGMMNDIGDLLQPQVVVLLIGERPGLATAESLSAYLAYRPTKGCTDADRNLISNIHSRGTPPEEAAHRVVELAEKMIRIGKSGVSIKEETRPTIDSFLAPSAEESIRKIEE